MNSALPLLRKAWNRFRDSAPRATQADYERFAPRKRAWLEDWALFAAIKRSQGGKHWVEWEAPLRGAQAPQLAAMREKLADELAFEKFAQYLF